MGRGVDKERAFFEAALAGRVGGGAASTATSRRLERFTLLYLVRHGETDWNRTMRIQGHSDIELNDHGVAQARRLGARLARWRIDRAIASDLVRAQETARLALGDRAIPLELDGRLRERNFGEWEGLTREEVEARDPEGARRWREEPWTFRPPGASPWPMWPGEPSRWWRSCGRRGGGS